MYTAVTELERKGEEKWRPSTGYDLLHKGKFYPPKEVIRYAGYTATGEEPIDFAGGDEANNILIDLGFTIVIKGTGKIIPRDYVRKKCLKEGTIYIVGEGENGN